MTMDLAALQAAVTGGLSGTTFTLDGGAFSMPVATLLAAFLPAPSTLPLSGATVDATGAEPTATGTLATAPSPEFAFLAGMTVQATFRLDAAQEVQVSLAFTPPATTPTWGIHDAIPVYGPDLLGPWTWGDARLVADSAAPAHLLPDFPEAYGLPVPPAGSPPLSMAFSGTLRYAGTDPGLVWLMGTKPVAISGPIEWWPNAPRMDLATATLTSRSVEGFTLPLALHLVSVPLPGDLLPKGLAAHPLVVLAGELDRDPLTIPFTVRLLGPSLGLVSVVASPASATPLLLDQVADVLGAGSLTSQQGSFPALAGLALETVRLDADLMGPSLVLASVTVSYTPPKPWKPFGDVISFDGMAVTFTAIGPMTAPLLETSVEATATLQGGGILDASVSLPGTTFHCWMPEGSPPIDLTEIMKGVVGDLFGDFTLLCTALDVLADVPGQTYRFQTTIQDQPPWTFSAGGFAFGLSSVGFDISYSTATGTADGQVVAQLLLGDVPVQLSATYAGATEGWTFTGGTMGPQDISLTDLMSDALHLFGLDGLPASVPEVLITDLSMMLDTATHDFGFSCSGSVTMLGKEVGIEIDLGRTRDDPSQPASTVFQGYLTIGSSTFEVDITAAPGAAGMAFTWSDPTDPLTFGDIAGFFGLSLPPIPEGMDLHLTAAGFSYDFDTHALTLHATSVHGEILFVSAPRPAPATTWIELFALQITLGLDVAALPVVGELVPDGVDVAIHDVAVILSSDALLAADVIQANGLLAALEAGPLPAPTLAAGVTLGAHLQLGTDTRALLLPLSSPAGPAPAPAPPALPPAAGAPVPAPAAPPVPAAAGGASAGARWLVVDSTFGPVHIARIGMQYEGDTLFVALDASLTLGPLAVGVLGLGAGSPLTHVSLKVRVDGLSVALSAGPVELSGGLLVDPAPPDGVDHQYVGELTVAVAPWQITAVGAYARIGGHPAFFAFAQVNGDFGGPPAFFVTGLMGGFGYHYALTVPTPDDVFTFPFLTGFDDPTVFPPSPTPSDVIAVLMGQGGRTAWVTPAAGTSWGALGVIFRSFELILGRALVIVQVGDEVEIALLGLATLSLPQGADETYLFVQLQLEVVIEPDQGYIGVQASLTPASYLLTPDCHLTGGFAFCLWFGPNPHAGDFVVSIGGYHPAFTPPAWYPQVAPVGFSWSVGGGVTVGGSAYFALTPSAAMAGIDLRATYQSGDLRAWFHAWANALVTWKPFYVDVSIGISVGASYRLDLLFTTVTLSVELGAQLEVWGPPTGGRVHVDWYIISFTIGFGSDRIDPDQQTLDWAGVETLLPSSRPAGPGPPAAAPAALVAATDPARPPAVLATSIESGLAGQDDATGAWLVRADQLVLSATSAVPASLVRYGTTATAGAHLVDTVTPDGIEIRPMNGPTATSTLTVTVTHLDDQEILDLTQWTPTPVDRNLPSSLWGAPLQGVRPDPAEATVPSTSGVRLVAPRATVGPTPGEVDMTALVEALAGGPALFDATAQAPQLPAPVPTPGSIAVIAQTFAAGDLAAVTAAQQSLLTTLAAFDAAPPTSGVTARLGAAAGSSFAEPPMIVTA